jgi:hypothetical protein
MNKTIKAITTAALATATVIGTNAKALNVDPGHFDLGKAVVSTGVQLKINPMSCFPKEGLMGWYWSTKNELVVCQQNATRPDTEVYWTAEDFDTLRHEAQHLIQDCMDGSQNGELSAVYKDPIQVGKAILSTEHLQGIVQAYSDKSEHIIVLEIEAFAVAAMNNPAEQVQDINKYCF